MNFSRANERLSLALLLCRAVERLFTLLSSKGSFEMYCSFLEIYNEQVYDLIANHSGIAEKGRQVNSLGIRGAVTNGLPEVMGLSRIAVESPRALMELVNKYADRKKATSRLTAAN